VDLDKLYKHVAGSEEAMGREAWQKMFQVVYKVSKSTVLTEEMDVKSKMLRRVDPGEFIQGTGAKRKDDTNVARLPCKACSDGADGWVTATGSKGMVFLEPRSNYYVCVGETVMSESLSLEAKTVKKVLKGELLEVVEYERKDETAGVMRVKAKSLTGSAEEGWVTLAGTAGTAFLELC